MNKIKGKQFFKTDKDIYDQLVQRSPSKSSILYHLKQRGLLFSHDLDKQELAETISPWFTSYFDQKFIVDELGGSGSYSKNDYSEVLLDFDSQEIKEILSDMKSDLGISFTQSGESLEVLKNYTKSDFTKNTLSQNIEKTAQIKLEKTKDNKILIRGNSDEEADRIINTFKEKIKEKHSDDYTEFKIDLSNISDPITRTNFLLKLSQSIEGYDICDMQSASIYKMNKPDSLTEADEETVGFIKRMVLNGGSVHTSSELNKLLSEEFYLTKIDWTMKGKLASDDKIDLCAEFNDYINCKEFRYALKRVYKSKDNGEHNSTGQPPTSIHKQKILPKIESSAKKIYNEIIKSQIDDNSDDKNMSEHEDN
ncbi:hypothetical protein [Psychrobacter sp. I-STPA10]|uniref:hypothetical protein n=1 Tax=Psychrobacter sp. I-STPA10 TaxID=2585769 RepID=UPI001E51D1B5|nr:hypothetical protein [Psychrobacter sp. I-STPA10]